MRVALALIVLAAPLAPGTLGGSPAPGKRGVVRAPAGGGVTARSGPSDTLPDTGFLPDATQVVVAETLPGGWLAIEPPLGQVSWMRYIHLVDPDALPGTPGAVNPRGSWQAVVSPESGELTAEVAHGRANAAGPLNVRKIKVPAGTVITVTGPFVEHAGAKWLPVVPPAGDYRYVPASAIELLPGAAPGFTVTSPAPPAGPPPGAGAPPPSGTGGAGRTPLDQMPLWTQAERAERDGDFALAERKYLELAGELGRADRPDDASTCMGRVTAAREKAARAGAPRSQDSPAGDARPGPAKWYGPGVLRLTTLRVEGRVTYALNRPSDGKAQCYALAAPGVDLESLRGKTVNVYGTFSFPTNDSLNGLGVITVSRAQEAKP